MLPLGNLLPKFEMFPMYSVPLKLLSRFPKPLGGEVYVLSTQCVHHKQWLHGCLASGCGFSWYLGTSY
jgi:hypothetical protein